MFWANVTCITVYARAMWTVRRRRGGRLWKLGAQDLLPPSGTVSVFNGCLIFCVGSTSSEPATLNIETDCTVQLQRNEKKFTSHLYAVAINHSLTQPAAGVETSTVTLSRSRLYFDEYIIRLLHDCMCAVAQSIIDAKDAVFRIYRCAAPSHSHATRTVRTAASSAWPGPSRADGPTGPGQARLAEGRENNPFSGRWRVSREIYTIYVNVTR